MAENDSIHKYIQQFIQENRKIYTRDAITQKLVEAGYSVNDIDAAYEALGMGWDVTDKQKPDAMTTPGNWRSAQADIKGFLIFFPGIPILVYILMPIINGWNLFVLSYGVVFLVGTFLPMYVKNRNPGLAKGMIYGFRTLLVVFICLPILGIAALWGICMVANGGRL